MLTSWLRNVGAVLAFAAARQYGNLALSGACQAGPHLYPGRPSALYGLFAVLFQTSMTGEARPLRLSSLSERWGAVDRAVDTSVHLYGIDHGRRPRPRRRPPPPATDVTAPLGPRPAARCRL